MFHIYFNYFILHGLYYIFYNEITISEQNAYVISTLKKKFS
jgi:hypothetical protein